MPDLPYRDQAEQYITHAQACDLGQEAGGIVNALTAIAYALIDLSDAIDRHEG